MSSDTGGERRTGGIPLVMANRDEIQQDGAGQCGRKMELEWRMIAYIEQQEKGEREVWLDKALFIMGMDSSFNMLW